MNDSSYLTDKANIPKKGERLDQTLLKFGKDYSFNTKTELREPALIAKSIIDNGNRANKKLSCPFFSIDSEELIEFGTAIGIDLGETDTIQDIFKQIEPKLRNARFSAMVYPIEFETDQGIYIRYQQCFFDKPQNERQIHIQQEPTQFLR